MIILVVMCVGILIGFTIFPKKYLKINNAIQFICTAVLIFCMGVGLGSRPKLFDEIKNLGFQSFIFTIVAITLSIVVVYFLTKKFKFREK